MKPAEHYLYPVVLREIRKHSGTIDGWYCGIPSHRYIRLFLVDNAARKSSKQLGAVVLESLCSWGLSSIEVKSRARRSGRIYDIIADDFYAYLIEHEKEIGGLKC